MTNGEIRTSKADELRVVNHSIDRHDAVEKIEGRARYAGDGPTEGMLHARLVRAQVPSARIVSRDVSDALRIPGVVAVFLGEDVPVNRMWMNVPGQSTDVRELKASIQVLATERVRYHGEPVAIVVAESEDVLAEAVEAVRVDYEDLPVVGSTEEALAEGAPTVHESGNLLAEWNVDRGDVDTAFAEADVIVEGEYRTQFVDSAYLEPEVGVGWLDDHDVVVIRTSTQALEHFRDVAKILGLPTAKVRVVAPYVGGGFGGKETMTVEPFVGLCVHRLRRPVRMMWTRQESLLARAKRHPMRMRYRTAARADGTLLGQDIDITADSGAYASLSPLVLLYSAVNAGGPYRMEHARIRTRVVYTNNPPTSAMRGFGAMQVVFGYESQMDRLARALWMDRAEVRKRNAISDGDELPVGQRLETKVLLADTIDAVAAAAGPKPPPSGPNVKVGRGMASNLQPYGRCVWLGDSSSAWIGLERDGSARVRIGIPDIGGGQASSLTQITSEVLGVPVAGIAIHFGDSALTPLAGTTTASRQTYMSGNAVLKAATSVRDTVARVVADELGEQVRSLSFDGGTVHGPGDLSMAIGEAVALCQERGVSVEALETFAAPIGLEVNAQVRGRVFPDFTFGTHLVDLEVDVETGIVRLLRYVASHDVGRAINPQSVEGQIRGGATMGIGSALLEEVVVQDGVNLTGGFFQYLIPTAADVPPIECVIVESGEGLGPFGARGIGEAPIGPPAAAIAGAIEDAVGARPTVLPITPERVLACVDEGAAAERVGVAGDAGRV